jgi:hypothetical protein
MLHCIDRAPLEISAYEGDLATAEEAAVMLVEHGRRRVRFLPFLWFGTCWAAARACLHAWSAFPTDRRRARRTRAYAKMMHRAAGSIDRPLRRLVEAGIAFTSGDRVRGEALLRQAIGEAERADYQGFVACARYQLGRVTGGAEGAQLSADAEAFLRAEGVVNPARFAVMLVPGFATR